MAEQWVLLFGEESVYRVVGIFPSKKAAEEWLSDQHKNDRLFGYAVPFQVDEATLNYITGGVNG